MTKKKRDSPFSFPDVPLINPQDEVNAKAILQSAMDKQSSENQPITQRQYFKPADFKILQNSYNDLERYNISLIKLLKVTPRSQIEGTQIKKLMEINFEKLKKALHTFITLWTQRTSGFLGSKDEYKQVYRSLIDEVKAIVTIASTPTRQQLEIVVISMNDILEWLISQALPFSIGEISNITHGQSFNLEKTQLMSQSGMAYIADRQSRFGKILKKMSFKRGKDTTTPDGSGLSFLPSGDID